MTIMADHRSLSAGERQAMREGEDYGRRHYRETEERLNADLKANPSVGFDPELVLNTFAAAAKTIERIADLRAVAGQGKEEATAWCLGAENTFVTEVRVFWRELLRSLAEAHPTRADDFLAQENTMMEMTQRRVLPHRKPIAPPQLADALLAQTYIAGAKILLEMANRTMDRA